MTREAVTRQFFIDFLENLGDKSKRHEYAHDFYDDEEANVILADMFFAGQLELKWNLESHTLMLKPRIVIQCEGELKSALEKYGRIWARSSKFRKHNVLSVVFNDVLGLFVRVRKKKERDSR